MIRWFAWIGAYSGASCSPMLLNNPSVSFKILALLAVVTFFLPSRSAIS